MALYPEDFFRFFRFVQPTKTSTVACFWLGAQGQNLHFFRRCPHCDQPVVVECKTAKARSQHTSKWAHKFVTICKFNSLEIKSNCCLSKCFNSILAEASNNPAKYHLQHFSKFKVWNVLNIKGAFNFEISLELWKFFSLFRCRKQTALFSVWWPGFPCLLSFTFFWNNLTYWQVFSLQFQHTTTARCRAHHVFRKFPVAVGYVPFRL